MTSCFHIVIAMKPIEGTFAENALKHGVAGLAIDACRIGTEMVESGRAGRDLHKRGEWRMKGQEVSETNIGRFPANILHDNSPEVLAGFPKAGGGFGTENRAEGQGRYGTFSGLTKGKVVGFGDSGSAARFFHAVEEYSVEDGDQ